MARTLLFACSITVLWLSFVSLASAQTYQIEAQVHYAEGDGEDETNNGTKIDKSSSQTVVKGTYYLAPVKKQGPISHLEYMQRISSIGFRYEENEETEKVQSSSVEDTGKGQELQFTFYLPDNPVYFEFNYGIDKTDRNYSFLPDEEIEQTTTTLGIGYFLQDYLSVGYVSLNVENEYKVDPLDNTDIKLRGFLLRNILPQGDNYFSFEFILLQGDVETNFGFDFDVDSTWLTLIYSFADDLELEYSYQKIEFDLPDTSDATINSFTLRKPLTPIWRVDLEYSSDSQGKDESDEFGLYMVARF